MRSFQDDLGRNSYLFADPVVDFSCWSAKRFLRHGCWRVGTSTTAWTSSLNSRVPMLDDGFGGVYDGAVHVEQKAVEGNPDWRGRKV